MHILMTVEVGNTNIEFGLMEGDILKGTFRLTTRTPRTSDEFGICIRSLLWDNGLKKENVDDVIVCSVVPERMYALNSAIRKYLGKEPILVGPGIRTGISIRSENPKEIGSDRIVNVAAAHFLYPDTNVIVVDFGTATTFDHVSKTGILEYTIIQPGIGICASALKDSTARLPGIEIAKPKRILQKNTVGGMQAGLVYGYIGSVEGIIRRMKKELQDPDCLVLATGGMGRVIADSTGVIDAYDPDLAHKGLRILYNMNRKA